MPTAAEIDGASPAVVMGMLACSAIRKSGVDVRPALTGARGNAAAALYYYETGRIAYTSQLLDDLEAVTVNDLVARDRIGRAKRALATILHEHAHAVGPDRPRSDVASWTTYPMPWATAWEEGATEGWVTVAATGFASQLGLVPRFPQLASGQPAGWAIYTDEVNMLRRFLFHFSRAFGGNELSAQRSLCRQHGPNAKLLWLIDLVVRRSGLAGLTATDLSLARQDLRSVMVDRLGSSSPTGNRGGWELFVAVTSTVEAYRIKLAEPLTL